MLGSVNVPIGQSPCLQRSHAMVGRPLKSSLESSEKPWVWLENVNEAASP